MVSFFFFNGSSYEFKLIFPPYSQGLSHKVALQDCVPVRQSLALLPFHRLGVLGQCVFSSVLQLTPITTVRCLGSLAGQRTQPHGFGT